jgi:hypothetical protein
MSKLRKPTELEEECRRQLSLHRASLIGEVPWSADLVEALGRTWKAIAQQKGIAWGAKRFPISLAVHLVTVANRTYEDGDLWSAFPHIPPRDRAEAGRAFERALRLRALERFPQFAHEGALRYVAPILAHGGIPQRLVVRFLRQLLLPALRNAEGSTAEELIGRWRATEPAGIPRPVLRFLRYGGATAVDFVARCVELTRIDRDELRRDPSISGLPPSVVEAFLDIPEREVVRISAQTRPVIWLDPWDDRGPVVRLPPVGREASAGLTWVVEDQRVREFPASAHTERLVELSPAEYWTITERRGSESGPPVRVEALGVTQIVCFDATGSFISDERGLRADDLWIISRADAQLIAIEGDAERELTPIENGAELAGAWTDYRLRRYSLEGVELLGVRRAGLITDRIPVARAGDHPALVGEPVRDVRSTDALPVYAEMPRLSLPAGRWRVVLEGPGRPVPKDIEVKGGSQTVDLAELWGVLPFGRFSVVARGALGRDLRPAAFAVVPGLQVGTPDDVVAPSVGALDVRLAAEAPITLHPDVLRLGPDQRADEAWAWIGRKEKVGLIVTVPRLCWDIRYRGRDEEFNPRTERFRLAPDELGTVAEALVISTGRANRTVEVRLTGADVSQPGPSRPTNDSGIAVLPLAVFRDTARVATSGFSLELSVGGVHVTVAEYRPARQEASRPTLPSIGTQVEAHVTAVRNDRLVVEGDGWTGHIYEDRLPKHAHEYGIGDRVVAWVIDRTAKGLRLDAKPFEPERFRVGQDVEATVVRVTPDSVWLDVLGARGRLDEAHAPTALDVYRRGQRIRVRVLRINLVQRLIEVTALSIDPSAFPVGSTVRGRVRQLRADRLLLDLPGALGFIRRGETEPGRSLEAYRKGDEVEGTVVRVHGTEGTVELSARPWAPGVREGDCLVGRVERINPTNLLVRLPPGDVGGLPRGKLPPHIGAAPEKHFPVGAEIPVRVAWVDRKMRKIGLVPDLHEFTFGDADDESPFSVLR